MPRIPPEQKSHRDWLALIRPTGLVVAAPALVRAGAILPRRDADGQRRLLEWLEDSNTGGGVGSNPPVAFRTFAESVLGWEFLPDWYAVRNELSPDLPAVHLPEYAETLFADFAVREPDARPATPPPAARDAANGMSPWQLVVALYGPNQDLDKTFASEGHLNESPNGRMERLLRATGIPAGLVWGGRRIRLVSAPRGESSGYLDFVLDNMVETAGRPLLAALRLLLSQDRLLSLPTNERLPALLSDSRKYQNEVSERLADQVLHGLYDLLRGIQAADAARSGALLRDPLREAPDDVYRALLAVILRLVFLLYAEQRGLLPDDDETFGRHYSLMALFERLRADEAFHPDTMDQRYGAWAHLLALFRMVHDGARSDRMRLPPRHGALFDPNRYPFLEGRIAAGGRQLHERIEPPLLSDGTVLAVLKKLLILDGERISYRALDVEQIGSVYETMMGFRLERAEGPSVAVKSPKKHGAPSVVNLEALLSEPSGSRGRWVQQATDRKLTERVLKAVASASSVERLHAALDPVVDRSATPDIAQVGSLLLQPNEERRRSGSHYTPRALTEPIVRRTLEPVLVRLREAAGGSAPRPEAVLDLKVCDPAMGSGAFLVEACRQLGDALIEAWKIHGGRPEIPPDEDETIFARRLIAQKCLYGVDRNPLAVDLAKLSLWLVTLAKDHPLTFLDHALRAGDSLVGLSRNQIERVDWKTSAPDAPTEKEVRKVFSREQLERMDWVGKARYIFARQEVGEALSRVIALRQQIRNAGEAVPDDARRALWKDAKAAMSTVRLFGNLVVAAFFGERKPAARERERRGLAADVLGGRAEDHRSWVEELRAGDPPLAPFHWEIEFPEVFDRENPGFDAFVGNPPFAGKNTVIAANPPRYLNWLKETHRESHGNSDLVAHFFRRGFHLLREGGTLGLIATNTIAQGDTRSTGLRWICENGGVIYDATRRYKWPGQAAVVVSVIHLGRRDITGEKRLDGKPVQRITAFLFDQGGNANPVALSTNAGKSFVGTYVLGMGFTFDDTDRKGVATPLAEMRRLIASNPRNKEVIFPYIGGEEVNTSPTHTHHRYVINFQDFPLRRDDLGEKWSDVDESQRRGWLRTGIVPFDYPNPVAADWPDLLEIAEQRVKPERLRQNDRGAKAKWWQFIRPRPELHAAISSLDRVLVISRLGQIAAFARVAACMVLSERLIVFPFASHSTFCALQSRPHEVWVRFFGSTMKDDLLYTPSDVFETFPFPDLWECRSDLETAGKLYYEHRAALMVANDEGLTRTYNRFHDPYEHDRAIQKLRDLHTAMDRAVLDAYGWTDIPTGCDFFPLHPDDEDDPAPSARPKRKPHRYRWPDRIQNEVLARLLDLNTERADAEQKRRTTG